ncbi:MAG: TIGR00289 family protein [Archaeoglobaceae archaeon]
MRVAALVSGGKDSMLALHRVAEKHDVACVVTAVPERDDSWMFHTVNLHMVDAIAECLGKSVVKVPVSGEKEKEVEEFASALEGLEVDALCIGAVASRYQKERIEKVCDRLGFELIAPLWGEDPVKILREVSRKFEVLIVGVAAEGVERFLARKIDEELVEELLEVCEARGVNPVGEGGEYETLVLDAPLYNKKIKILKYDIIREGFRGYAVVRSYKFVSKN